MADLGASRRRRGGGDWDAEEEEEEAVDQFDRLPEPVLLVVLNKIGDVKALGRCCVVSRRFHDIVPQVESVVVRVDCVISDDPSSPPSGDAAGGGGGGSEKARGVFSSIARLVLGSLVKPLQALGQILGPVSSSGGGGGSSHGRTASGSSSSTAAASPPEVSHHSPSEVLRNFKEIRRLRIELPAGELSVEDGVLLKWKACFGSTLDSCVILGASSISSPICDASPDNPVCASAAAPPPLAIGSDDSGGIPESFYTNGSLKLRVVWTISSLIAASARHYLLQPIITDHETLESLDLTDADGQGTLTMNKLQLQELRVRPVLASGSSQRTLVPALNMRLWYAPHLELPGGVVLEGATLVAIRPSGDQLQVKGDASVSCSDGFSWVPNAFEEPYRTAAKLLVKRRTYCLEMNSF